MPLLAVRRRSLAFAAAILTACVGATAVVDVKAVSAQAPKTKKAPTHSEQSTSEGDAPAGKGTQAIVVLVNDEPITAWEIEQRASLIATSSGGNPRDMKAKAEARWAQIVKDPRTNERFAEYMRQHNVQSEQQAKALQAEFVKKLQSDMIEQIRRESRAGMTAQFRKQAQEELIEERLKVQEGKRLGVEVPDDEAKRLLQAVADRNKMTVEQFSQNVKNSGFDVSTLGHGLRLTRRNHRCKWL